MSALALALVPGRICSEPTTRLTKNGGQVTVVKRNATTSPGATLARWPRRSP